MQILPTKKPLYKKVLLYKLHRLCKMLEIVFTMFTFMQSEVCDIVINICKQFVKNDYFDFSGILYSFAAASA